MSILQLPVVKSIFFLFHIYVTDDDTALLCKLQVFVIEENSRTANITNVLCGATQSNNKIPHIWVNGYQLTFMKVIYQ